MLLIDLLINNEEDVLLWIIGVVKPNIKSLRLYVDRLHRSEVKVTYFKRILNIACCEWLGIRWDLYECINFHYLVWKYLWNADNELSKEIRPRTHNWLLKLDILDIEVSLARANRDAGPSRLLLLLNSPLELFLDLSLHRDSDFL